MSPRERLLLIMLCAVAILFGGYKFLIEPGIKQMSDIKASLVTMEDKLLTSKNNVMLAASINDINVKLENDILTNSTPFFPELVQEKMHVWLQTYLAKNAITPISLTINSPIITEIKEVVSATKATVYPIGDAANAISEIDKGKIPTTTANNNAPTTSPVKSEEVPKDTVEMIAVSLQYEGTYEQTLKFLDSIYNSGKYIKVTSATITTAEGKSTIDISAECYGVKKYINNSVY